MSWKDRRKLSYLMHEFDDVGLSHSYIALTDKELVEMVINFFKTESLLVYPAKSYFVAIVYAHCIKKYFGEDFYEVLNDKELLFDDKYFIPYKEDKSVYDEIIKQIGDIDQYKSIEKTVNYFKQEMLVEDN